MNRFVGWLLEALFDNARVTVGGSLVRKNGRHTKRIESYTVPETPAREGYSLHELLSFVWPVIPVEDGESVGAVHAVDNQCDSLHGE